MFKRRQLKPVQLAEVADFLKFWHLDYGSARLSLLTNSYTYVAFLISKREQLLTANVQDIEVSRVAAFPQKRGLAKQVGAEPVCSSLEGCLEIWGSSEASAAQFLIQ